MIISDEQTKVIKHARKAFLFSEGPKGERVTWQKKNGEFDVTMGAPDGAEICELVGLFLLHEIKSQFPRLDFGLYRDDGLAVHGRIPKRELEGTQQKLREIFRENGLRITFENPHNTKKVNFLDVTLDLCSESFMPYRKPNDKPLYVHVLSNHPPNVIKQIPQGINKRLARISSTDTDFKKASPLYQKALQDSGYNHTLSKPPEAQDAPDTSSQESNTEGSQRTKRKIIYFNPPFNQALKTKIGKVFLELVKKHFPRHHKLHPILNRNTLKISYSCTPNIRKILQAHNKKIMRNRTSAPEEQKKCNCQASRKDNCPLNGNCNQKNVIYKVTTSETDPHFYVGVTECFKARWNQHKQSFKKEELKNSTALSTYVWDNDLGREPDLKWEIIDKAPTYTPGQRSCQLCLTEKLHILILSKHRNCLNRRSEIAQTCRHKTSYKLARVKGPT